MRFWSLSPALILTVLHPQAGEDFGEGIDRLWPSLDRGFWFISRHQFEAREPQAGQSFEAFFHLGPGGLGGSPEAWNHSEFPGADHKAALHQAEKDRMALQGRAYG